MTENGREDFPINIYGIIKGQIKNGLIRRHETYLSGLHEEGVSDEMILEGAKILKDLRIREIKGRLDSLTGLPDAKLCREIIVRTLGKNKTVSIEFLDVLFLKTFNDTIGHERTNKEVLVPMARVYQRTMRGFHEEGKEVVIGRYAGDTFLVIVVGEEDDEAKKISEKIVEELQGVNKPEGALIKPSFSRGFVSSRELETPSFSQLIEKAETRANEAKEKAKEEYKKDPVLWKEIQRYG